MRISAGERSCHAAKDLCCMAAGSASLVVHADAVLGVVTATPAPRPGLARSLPRHMTRMSDLAHARGLLPVVVGD
jgi:hypothetical protein